MRSSGRIERINAYACWQKPGPVSLGGVNSTREWRIGIMDGGEKPQDAVRSEERQGSGG
jgi:hypothetical protein